MTHPALVFLVQRPPRRRGHQVSGFTDPREAAAVLRADPQKFDLLVTDLQHARLFGRGPGAQCEIRRPPVALASGHVTAEIEQSARARRCAPDPQTQRRAGTVRHRRPAGPRRCLRIFRPRCPTAA